MSDLADAEVWLRLALTPGLGSISLLRLLQAFGTPGDVLSASPASLSKVISKRVVSDLLAYEHEPAVVAALNWLEQPTNQLVTLADDLYPSRLLETVDPPPVLYVKGNPSLLSAPSVAVVGSRNATPQGLENAENFSAELSAQGWCIVSGLALGIDAAAHKGGLAGTGSTVAVVGTGLDIVYPARNHALAHEVAQKGALVSEFPLGTPAKAGHFPRRNRIISGLARGTLVVEAALASGSLITAREAVEQGREVFAIPGSIHSPLSKGCHALIKQGAKLVETAADIVEELGDLPGAVQSSTHSAVDQIEHELLKYMGYDLVDVDTLCNRASLTPDKVCAMLLELELAGAVAALPGGRYQRLGQH
ncbi:DNA-processing protein DprA [Parachitinimonas caeni]|uniref:DNA-processing protein DprA n=1 Tax=Parachitinimonas caeni TaxID=3031301 RepID=A0ABT7DY34_9NEIS|nr:DNA-processing protein DprA [Parachitinimonas caeni]MDK2124987.1 DNA-processing protein DprA [Parachitinimonas caeni]